MSDLRLTFGSEAPAELVHFGLAVASSARSAGRECVLRGNRAAISLPDELALEPPLLELEEHLLVEAGNASGRLALDEAAQSVVLMRGPRSDSLPFTVDPRRFPVRTGRRTRELARILFRGGSGRRVRMTMSVLHELRRRRWPFTALCHHPVDPLAHEEPDELFEGLLAAEWASLLTSSGLVLETSDEHEAPSFEARAALRIGLPLVMHSSTRLDRRQGSLVAGEWSADAFADLLMQPTSLEAVEPPASDTSEATFRSLMELLEADA